jgi:hypothetical protein
VLGLEPLCLTPLCSPPARCPEVQEYKLYYAQSLFKAGLYEPAMKACQNVDQPDEPGRGRVLKLQASDQCPKGGSEGGKGGGQNVDEAAKQGEGAQAAGECRIAYAWRLCGGKGARG